jgi:hypothetical protein
MSEYLDAVVTGIRNKYSSAAVYRYIIGMIKLRVPGAE